MPKNHRCCVSCRRIADRAEFWRVVTVGSAKTVQIDLGMGRSAYLCPQKDCLTAAQKKNRLGRALKTNVAQEIYQQLSSRLSGGENGL
jgi:uncharacterized protein